MELNEKKKLVIRGFGLIYAVFAIILIYLFFLSPSVELKEVLTDSGKIVFITNPTERQVNNITVYFFENNEKKIVKKIEFLKPREEKEIDLNQFKGKNKVKLFAEAPFHNPFELTVLLETMQVKLSYNVKVQKSIFKNTEFELILEVCNKGKTANGIKIKESHETSFFKEQPIQKTINVKTNECKEISYTLTPIETGLTMILFNIEFENNTGSITKELIIKETQNYSTDINNISD